MANAKEIWLELSCGREPRLGNNLVFPLGQSHFKNRQEGAKNSVHNKSFLKLQALN